jgi:hypothetical protein
VEEERWLGHEGLGMEDEVARGRNLTLEEAVVHPTKRRGAGVGIGNLN